MTQPVPLDEATQLYNEAVGLDGEDAAAAARLAFRLRRYASKQPHNFGTRVALVRALSFCGNRGQAGQELQTALELLDLRNLVAIAGLGRLLLSFGEFERARVLLDRARPTLEQAYPFEFAEIMAQLGFFSGDVSLIEQGAVIEQQADRSGLACRFQDYIEASGMGPYLVAHQEMVFAVVRPHQMWVTLHFDWDGDSEVPTIWVRHHVDMDWPEIRKLRNAMWEALDDLEQRSGAEGAVVSPFLSHDILPVDRVPVFQVA